MAGRFIVGLDIGTAAVKVVAVEERQGVPLVRLVAKSVSEGLRKGVVVDVADLSRALARVLGDVRKLAKPALRNAYVSIGTPHVKTQASRGIVAVSRADAEIYEEDVERVIRASQAVNLPPNRLVVHHIPREFVVDGVGDVTDPLGLSGSRLEVASLIVDAFAPHVKDVMRAVELGGGKISGMVITPLGGSRAALSKRQKELGAVFIDIGCGTTGMSVYEEGKLLGVAIFPMGGGNITNDIAIGLKIPVDAAEAIKVNYGCAVPKEVGNREGIELGKFIEGETGSVSRRFVAEIIESRLAEIFEFVHTELKALGKVKGLAGGAILAGGGAKMPGIADLAKQELKLSTCIGFVQGEEWGSGLAGLSEHLEDPEFVNAFGLVRWALDREMPREANARSSFSLRKLFRYFLP